MTVSLQKGKPDHDVGNNNVIITKASWKTFINMEASTFWLSVHSDFKTLEIAVPFPKYWTLYQNWSWVAL